MSRSKKKGRKPNDSIKVPRAVWRFGIALVAIIILMGGAVLFLTPEQAAYVPEVMGGPRVAVAQEKVDFGDVKLDTTVEAVFHVRNIGDEVLQFLDYEPLVELKDGC